MASRKCRCGKTVAFVRVNGRLVPVDPAAVVYVVQMGRRSNQLEGVPANRLLGTTAPVYLVNHSSTCPMADEFTRVRSEKQPNVDTLVAAVKRLVKTPINWTQFAVQPQAVMAAIAEVVDAFDELTK